MGCKIAYMDKKDKEILQILQQDAGISNAELALRVNLSPSPCLRRVTALYEKGIIKKNVVLLEHQHLDLNLIVLVQVGLKNHTPKIMDNFAKRMRELDEVLECYLITGQAADYQLKVVVQDLDAYHYFLLKKLTVIDGVDSVQSSFVLQRVRETTALPIS